MAGWVEGLAAERAGWTARLDQGRGRCREPACFRWAEADPQEIGSLRVVIGDLAVLARLVDRPGLHRERHGFRVPRECQHSDSKQLDDRPCHVVVRRRGSDALRRGIHGYQQLTNALRQRADLRLLETHRDHGTTLASLKIERAAPRLTHGARDERIRLFEHEEAAGHNEMLQARGLGGPARQPGRSRAAPREKTKGIGEVPALRSLSPVIPRLGRRLRDVCPPNRVAAQPKGTEPHLSILN
jgi:hypothetical protein